MFKDKFTCNWKGCLRESGTFWAITFFILGVYLVAKGLNLITFDIPFWGAMFVLVGFYLAFKRLVGKKY